MRRLPKAPIMLPLDLSIPEDVPLSDGAVLKSLKTIEEVAAFWNEHKGTLPWVASGQHNVGEEAPCLHPWQWVFAPTRASAVRWASKWHERGITPVWLPYFAEGDGCKFIEEGLDSFVRARKWHEHKLEEGLRSGRWIAKNLPFGQDPEEWFYLPLLEESNPLYDRGTDTDMSLLHHLLQDLTFESFDYFGGKTPFELFDASSMESWLEDEMWAKEHDGKFYCSRWWEPDHENAGDDAPVKYEKVRTVNPGEYKVSLGRDEYCLTLTGEDMSPFKDFLFTNLNRCCPGASMWAEVPDIGTYRSLSKFLRTHGRFWEGKWTGSWEPATRKDPFLDFSDNSPAYRNALEHSIAYGLRYVEGLAFDTFTRSGDRRPLWTPTLHAWNADESGLLVDTTFGNGGLAYFGVEFSVDRAYDAWAAGDPGESQVLWDEHRGWPILQHLWTGENHELRFPRSPDLGDLKGKPLQHVKRELNKRSKQLSSEYRQKRELEKLSFLRDCGQDITQSVDPEE